MARKRKKSRGKKKGPSEAKPADTLDAGEASHDTSTTGEAETEVASAEEASPAPAALDTTPADDLDDLEWIDLDEDPVPLDPVGSSANPALTSLDADLVEISLDDDDDEADRERLIAETLAFVGEDAGLDSRERGPDSDGQPIEDLGGDRTDTGTYRLAGADDSEDPVSSEAPREKPEDLLLSGEYTLPPESSDRPPPRITPDALQALQGIQTEGLASVPPEVMLDLGDPDSPADRDRLLQAALAQAEMQDAIYRVPGAESQPRSAKPFIVTALLLVAFLLAVSPPGFLTPPPPPEVTVGDRLSGYRVALLLQSQQIEAFRSTTGRLPNSLAELERPLPGIQYVQSNARLYQLVLRTEDRTLIYDSAAPDPAFAALAARWVTTRETR